SSAPIGKIDFHVWRDGQIRRDDRVSSFPGVWSGCCMFLENPGNLVDDPGVLQAVVARVHDQLGDCARVVCTGIRHLAVAPTRAHSAVPLLGDDRMPLDIRIDWQAVDGQEKGMFPGKLIDARRQSLSEGPCESGRTVAGQDGGTDLLQGLPRWGVVMKMTRRTSAIGLKTIDPYSSSRAFAGPARFSTGLPVMRSQSFEPLSWIIILQSRPPMLCPMRTMRFHAGFERSGSSRSLRSP